MLKYTPYRCSALFLPDFFSTLKCLYFFEKLKDHILSHLTVNSVEVLWDNVGIFLKTMFKDFRFLTAC